MIIEDLPSTSPAGLRGWAKRLGIPLSQARERAIAAVVLRCFAADPTLSRSLVFKGGNALRFVFGNPRSTIDLDFTVEPDGLADDATALARDISRAVSVAAGTTGVKLKLHGIERRPKPGTGTMPTHAVRLGYQFPGDAYYESFDQRPFVPTVAHVEISFGDLVCESIPVAFTNADEVLLRVCSLEDILAEKLRSLLQQPIRNRYRKQDVFDIARLAFSPSVEIDTAKIRAFLLRKCEVRHIEPRRSSFDDDVRQRSMRDYDVKIREQAGNEFIPFEIAWNAVMELIDRLNLPK